MGELDQLRAEIDRIDTEITRCYEQRVNVIEQVAVYKIQNGIDVLDQSRENAVIQNRVAALANSRLENDIVQLFQLIMKLSRARQQEILDGVASE